MRDPADLDRLIYLLHEGASQFDDQADKLECQAEELRHYAKKLQAGTFDWGWTLEDA